MRRAVLIASILLAALGLPASALAADDQEIPTLGVRVAGCQTGLALKQRAADFTGSMPAVAGSLVLAMRFDLEQRRGDAWKRVAVPGSRFERSKAGAAGFVFDKRVERLGADATYRVTVRFRWYDADGAVLKRATRRSGRCRQPDLRPDLSVAGIVPGEPLEGGRVRYLIRVANAGPSAALGTLRVGLAVDGATQASQAVSGLAAEATGTVAFEGPACRPGGTVRAVVDPQDGIDESDEADNALELRC